MALSLDSIIHAVKSAGSARSRSKDSVRVAVYVDDSATPFLVDAVREALVPQTTSALVRVERLTGEPAPVLDDTDIVLVLTCGSDHLERAVGSLLAAGAPVAVLAESSVEVPFIRQDTQMLSLIPATDKTHLLGQLSRWILDHTEKETVFAANFPFLRVAAGSRAISKCTAANTLTAILPWPRGADFPTMTGAQIDMLFQLAGIYGKPIDRDRAYEVAAVFALALALRKASRTVAEGAGRAAPLVNAAIAGAGTWCMGLGLSALYEHDVDYAPLNAALDKLAGTARKAVAPVASAVSNAMGRATAQAAAPARDTAARTA